MEVAEAMLLINENPFSASLDKYHLLMHYKMFGKDSFVYQHKDLLYDLYETLDLSMNDLDLCGEALEYLAKENKKVGPVLSAIYGIDKKEVLEKLMTMTAIAASSTAMTAILASSTAMTAILASSTAMTAIAASSTAMTAIVASSTAMTAIAASSTAMTAILASSTAMTAIAASSTAMTAIAASSTAMTAIAASSTAMTAIAASSTAMTALTKSYTALMALSRASDNVLKSCELNTVLYNNGTQYYKNIFDTLQANKSRVRITTDNAVFDERTYNNGGYYTSGTGNKTYMSPYGKQNSGILRLAGITNIDDEPYGFTNLERSFSGIFSGQSGNRTNLLKFTPVLNGDENEGSGMEMFAFGTCSFSMNNVYPHYYIYELN